MLLLLIVLVPAVALVRWWSAKGINSALRRAVLSADGKFLRIPTQGVTDRYLPAELYILDAWEEFYTIVSLRTGSRKVVVVGTPGIGLSQFNYYVMYRLLQENPYQPILLQTRPGVVTVVSIFGDWVCCITLLLLVGQFLGRFPGTFLADMKVPEEPACELYERSEITVVFARPSPVRFKYFLRQTDAIELILDPWRLSELLDARRWLAEHADMTEDQVMSQFEIYGGIPRYVFERRFWEDRFMNAALEAVGAHAVTAMFDSELEIPVVDEYVSHRVLHCYRKFPGDRCMGIKRYLPASQYVVDRLLITYPQLAADKFRERSATAVDNPNERGALLTVFERLFARSMATGGARTVARLAVAEWNYGAYTVPAWVVKAKGRTQLEMPRAPCQKPPRDWMQRSSTWRAEENVLYFVEQPGVRSAVAGLFMAVSAQLVVFQLALSGEHPVRGDGLVELYTAVSRALPPGTVSKLMLVFVHVKSCTPQVRTTQPLLCPAGCNYAAYEDIPELLRHLLVEQWRMDFDI